MRPGLRSESFTGLKLESALNTLDEFARSLAEDRKRAAELAQISGQQPQ